MKYATFFLKCLVFSPMLIFAAIPLAGLVVYWPIFSSYFFMEDFFFLQRMNVQSIQEFGAALVPMFDRAYRPVSQQLFFYVFQSLFHTNPVPYFAGVLLVHFANAYLFFQICKQKIQDQIICVMLSLLFVASPIFFTGLYSLVTANFIIALFFFQLAFLLWKTPMKGSWKFYCLSLLCFGLALFSSEYTAWLPIVLLLNQKLPIRKIFFLAPHGLLIAVNLFFNTNYSVVSSSPDTQIVPSAGAKLLAWYLYRALGLPEGIRNGSAGEIKLITALFASLLLILAINLLLQKKKLKQIFKQSLPYVAWFMLSGLPFYLMPYHLNPIYFSIAFMAFLLIVGISFNKAALYGFALVYIVSAFLSVRLLGHTHWMVRRANLAKTVLKTPLPVNHNVVTFYSANPQDLDELKLTLFGDKGAQFALKNKNIKVKYQLIQ